MITKQMMYRRTIIEITFPGGINTCSKVNQFILINKYRLVNERLVSRLVAQSFTEGT